MDKKNIAVTLVTGSLIVSGTAMTTVVYKSVSYFVYMWRRMQVRGSPL